MMDPSIVYAWERLPEYRATQQFSRCLGRILASLPRPVCRRVEPMLVRSAVMVGSGIAACNAELPPGERRSRAELEVFRNTALASIAMIRASLWEMREEGIGSKPDIAVALELLERVEAGLRARDFTAADPLRPPAS